MKKSNTLLAKKYISVIMVAIICSTIFYGANIKASLIWEKPTVKQFVEGVTLTNYNRLTSSGWQNINVAIADLNNPDLSINPLKDPSSVASSSSMNNLVKSNKALIGINASFFYYSDGDGKNNDVGLVMKDGVLLRSSADLNSTKSEMATLCQDYNGNFSVEYLKPYLFIQTEDGGLYKVARYNSSYKSHTSLSVFDRKYSATTPGSNKFPGTVELIVQNNKMVELREGLGPANIPENGFAVVTSGSGVKKLKSIFKEGRELYFDGFLDEPAQENLSTPVPVATPTPATTKAPDTQATAAVTPGDIIVLGNSASDTPTDAPTSVPTDNSALMPKKISAYKMMITGGATLVKAGTIPSSFSHLPNGSAASTVSARSAVGISKDGKKVYLVTVDNSNDNKGMGLNTLADYMKNLGCYYAINFDGSGSTKMSQSSPSYTSATLVNTPSDSRTVMNGLGIFTNNIGDGKFANLIISTKKARFFKDVKDTLTIEAYDNAYNAVAIDNKNIKYTVEGVEGTFSGGNKFTPTTTGTAIITAEYQGKTSRITIPVVGKPTTLSANKNSITLKKGKTSSLTITATNNEGYSFNPAKTAIKWSVSKKIGTISSKGVFTATKKGSGYVTAAYKGLTYSIPVSVYTSKTKKIANLKSKNTSNSTYTLPSNTLNLSVKVKNTKASSDKLQIKVVNKNKKAYTLTVCNNLNWTGTKTYTIAVSNITNPQKVTKIYTTLNNKQTKVKSLKLLQLSAEYGKITATSKVKLPSSSVFKDSLRITKAVKNPTTTIHITKQTGKVDTTRKTKILNSFATASNKTASALVTIGKQKYTYTKKFKSTYLNANTTSKSNTFDTVDIIRLDTTKGSVLSLSISQMSYLLQQLNNNDNYKVICTTTNPDKWPNARERKLFYDVVDRYVSRTGKQVTVITGGSKYTSVITNGVRMITVPDTIHSTSNKKYTYLELTIKNGVPKFRNVIAK